MRILDKTRSVLRLDDLGMPATTHAAYSKIVRSPFGMVLCAGPTGSGQDDDALRHLSEVNDPTLNIMTIEDPVEYVFPTINQIQTNEQAGLTFATGLRSILRQDPDVILVGEIRDVETTRVAVQSALTGHFVVSSLHATDSVSALHRFLDMGIESFLIASSVLAVVGQRLVRRICPSCKTTYTPTDEEMVFYEEAGGPPEDESSSRRRLQLLRQHRLQGADRRVRAAGHDARDPATDRRMGYPGGIAQYGRQAGHEHAPPGGDQPRGPGHHLDRRSHTEHVHAMSKRQVEVTPSSRTRRSTKTARQVIGCRDGGLHRSRPRRAAWPAGSNRSRSARKEHPQLRDHARRKCRARTLTNFTRQLAVFIRAGVPIMEALEVITEETQNKMLKNVLLDMIDSLRAGDTFAAAAAVHPEAFPNFYVGILESAELTGNLDVGAEPAGRLHRPRPEGARARSPRR